jgi:hypothetical protein
MHESRQQHCVNYSPYITHAHTSTVQEKVAPALNAKLLQSSPYKGLRSDVFNLSARTSCSLGLLCVSEAYPSIASHGQQIGTSQRLQAQYDYENIQTYWNTLFVMLAA